MRRIRSDATVSASSHCNEQRPGRRHFGSLDSFALAAIGARLRHWVLRRRANRGRLGFKAGRGRATGVILISTESGGWTRSFARPGARLQLPVASLQSLHHFGIKRGSGFRCHSGHSFVQAAAPGDTADPTPAHPDNPPAARIRAPIGISLPRSPYGYPLPSHFS